MDDIWPLCDELPQHSDREAQGEQQGWGVVEGKAEAKHIHYLQQVPRKSDCTGTH